MRKFAGVLAGVLLAAAGGAYFSGGASAAANDLALTGQGEGGPANVRTFGPDGKDGGVSYNANGTTSSGVRVAAGDVTGDGTPEIITGTGPGINAQVQVWSKDGKTLVAQANPFPGFNGGITVAAANEDETNAQEVIVAAGPGGGPHVKVLRLVSGQLQEIYSFYAYTPAFTGGVNVAATGGRIITGPGAGGGPHVKVFRIFMGELSTAAEWFAYGNFTGGVNVAAGAFRNEGQIDVITGAGPGGGPHVKTWSLDGTEGPGFFAYAEGFRGGVRVGVGQDEKLVTGAGPGGGPHVIIRSFKASDSTFALDAGWMAYSGTFNGGVYVAGFPATTTPSTTTTECAIPLPPLCDDGATTTTAAPTTTTTTPGTTTTTSSPSSTTTTTLVGTTTTTVAPTTTTTTTPATTTTTAEGGGLPIPI